jgi:hypothetical protein
MMRPFHPKGGAARDRHERGMECDGRGHVARRAVWTWTAKSCGPGAPLAGAKSADHGDLPATVTTKPVSPGRARKSLLTPSRRECRCSARTCGEYSCVLPFIAHKAAGAAQHPAFPAPSAFSRDIADAELGRLQPRERSIVFTRAAAHPSRHIAARCSSG